MQTTIAEDEQANEPDIVAMAKVLLPIAWRHEGTWHMRDVSLRMATRAREQFKLERQTSDQMIWEMGVMHGKRTREASPGYHWRAFWRAVFRRTPQPAPLCPHDVDWDVCPECCH